MINLCQSVCSCICGSVLPNVRPYSSHIRLWLRLVHKPLSVRQPKPEGIKPIGGNYPFQSLSLRHKNWRSPRDKVHLYFAKDLVTISSAMSPENRSVAVIGAGVAGLVCASTLAEQGVQVSLFDMGRGPGGRMSQRREGLEDGATLLFDHGAQYFTVKDPAVQSLVAKWAEAGVVAEWKGRFGTVDAASGIFTEEEETSKSRWVGVPGMDAMCQAMAQHPGVTPKFGVTVTGLEWGDHNGLEGATWKVVSKEGEDLGAFHAAVIAAAYKTFRVEMDGVDKLRDTLRGVEAAPCFALMVAFPTALSQVAFDGALVTGSEAISWVARDSSKPGRGGESNKPAGECWVVHSTAEFAQSAMSRAPAGRPSRDFLSSVAEELLEAFRSLLPGEALPIPIFMRAHRWGGAFPKAAAAPEARCLIDEARRLAACGDYCVSPRVESAILSGLAAADKIAQLLNRESSRL